MLTNDSKFILLKRYVLITIISIVAVLTVAFIYLIINEKRQTLDKELIYKKNQLEIVYMKYIEQMKLKYSNKLKILQNDKKVLELFAKRDRDALNSYVHPYFEELKKNEPNFEIICFGLPDSTAFLRAHRPDLYGDDISDVQGVKIVNDTKREVGGFMLTKLGLYYRVNTPIFYKDKYIGLISFGINIGAVNDFVNKTFKSDVAILIDTTKYKKMSWYDRIEEGTIANLTIVSSTNDFIEQNSEKFDLTQKTQKVQIGKKLYFTHHNNYIYDLNNNKIATIFLLQDITLEQKSFQYKLTTIIISSIVVLLVILYILIVSFNKMINHIISANKELNELNELLEQKVHERTKLLESETIRANEATAAKSMFLANMSHEIRTPLNAILGFVSLLKDSETDKERLKYLTTVDKSSQSLLQIINDILDFSKIESGKFAVEKTDFDTKEEFETLGELFKARTEEKNINFIVNISGKLPRFLNSDIQKIRQIVSNLLSNAVKFTHEGKSIELNIDYKDEDNELVVKVKDEGIGISKENQQSIFKPFSQEDAATTRKYGGTGLGLSISVAFVKMLGGELKLQSVIGKGSTFYFSIPVEIGAEVKGKEEKRDIELKGHILLVEDNKANQMFMKVILKKLNLTFDIANDGLEAVEKFKENRYDAVLMDENMPNMNGIEAAKKILEIERERDLKHTPIIALTANALKGDRERFLEAGMDEYLSKPVDKVKLSIVLDQLM